MKILIACEESQRVCIAFRKYGHDAYSCDLQNCSGGHPEWHLKQNVLPLLSEKWDLIIAHPPCTYLTVTGNRWFNVEKYGVKAIRRMVDREEAIDFFMEFINADCPRIAVENPVGIMSTRYRKPDQIIQPWQFGDPVEKTTCLWLKGLKPLIPTVTVKPDIKYIEWLTPDGKRKRQTEWYYQTRCLPHSERAKAASKTFPGIAEAMAAQWGNAE